MLIKLCFMQEAGLKMEDGGKEPFSELNRILDSLKQRDLGPALEWAQSHRESLDTQVNRRNLEPLCNITFRMSSALSTLLFLL
jgi:hypothetical protein